MSSLIQCESGMDMSDGNKHTDANLDAATSEEEWNLSCSNVHPSLWASLCQDHLI